MRAGFRAPLWLLSLVAPVQALTAGPLTPVQIARLRGVAAPVLAPAETDEIEHARADGPAERDALDGEGARQGTGPQTPVPALDFAPLAVRAALDLVRRQAAAEDEAALGLLLLLLEEI